MTRSTNSTHYKWQVIGTLCGTPIDAKYLSLNHFLQEFGDAKTELNLNRQKVNRLRNGWPCAKWDLEITPIRQARTKQITTVYLD